ASAPAVPAKTIDSTIAGPALSAAVVPLRTKIPVPITAPMPSVTRLIGPRTRRSPCSPVADASALICSMDFVAKIDMPRRYTAEPRPVLHEPQCRGIGLTQAGAVLGRREPGMALEAAREVALIAETGGAGDFAQAGRADELSAGEIDAQLPHVSSDSRLVNAAEGPREGHRVDTD